MLHISKKVSHITLMNFRIKMKLEHDFNFYRNYKKIKFLINIFYHKGKKGLKYVISLLSQSLILAN